MANTFNEPFGAKRVEIVILGDPLPPDQAQELIRRTDRAFYRLLFPVDDYGRRVRDRVGFPQDGTPAEVRRWRERWGAIDLHWLDNAQVLLAQGWCHLDGTIAWVAELQKFPRAIEILEDCQRLAAAFPDLFLRMAVWGGDASILGFPFTDAPQSPWPQALLDSQSPPTLGFRIGGGGVTVVEGTDRRLFEFFELTCPQAVERALAETRRCERLAVNETAIGDRGHRLALSDAIVLDWQAKARALGLVDAAGS